MGTSRGYDVCPSLTDTLGDLSNLPAGLQHQMANEIVIPSDGVVFGRSVPESSLWSSLGNETEPATLKQHFECSAVSPDLCLTAPGPQSTARKHSLKTRDHYVTLNTRYGLMRAPGGPDLITRFLRECGEWAWDEVCFVGSVLPEGARVLDAGAFIGTFGIGLSQTAHIDFLCSVEANTTSFEMLQANVAQNTKVRATVVTALIAGRPDVLRRGWCDPSNLGGTSFSGDPVGLEPVSAPARSLTLSDLRREHGPFDLVKLDVEGMEREIIESDATHLAQSETTLWVECNEHPRVLELCETLLSLGRPIYYFAFPSHNPDNFIGRADSILPWAYEAGLLVGPSVAPVLSSDLLRHRCILCPVGNINDLADAMWKTPRWLPTELVSVNTPELAAIVSRALLNQTRESFLTNAVTEPDTPESNAASTSEREGLRESESLGNQLRRGLDEGPDLRTSAERTLAASAANRAMDANILVAWRRDAEPEVLARLEASDQEQTLTGASENAAVPGPSAGETTTVIRVPEDALKQAPAGGLHELRVLGPERTEHQEMQRLLTEAAFALFRADFRAEQERARRERAEQQLAESSASSLSRLAEITSERDRISATLHETETRLSHALATVEAQLAHAEAQAAAARCETDAVQAQLAAIHETAAWRIAQPLMRFVDRHRLLRSSLRRLRAARRALVHGGGGRA